MLEYGEPYSDATSCSTTGIGRTAARRRPTQKSGRRIADHALDPQDQRASEAVVAITAAIILAPRLKALELRDSLPMRNLIQEAVSLAKLVLRKTEIELARDLAKADSGPPSC